MWKTIPRRSRSSHARRPSGRAARASPRSGASPSIRCAGMPWISSRAAALSPAKPASTIQSARQLRQNPARPIRSMFCASCRWRKWRTRRRKAAAATCVGQRVERVRIRIHGVTAHFQAGLCAGTPCHRPAPMHKLEPRTRKVKILATVGPASRDPEMLARLFVAGADAFRVNMSHGEHADHAATIAAIRALEKDSAARSRSCATCRGPSCASARFEGGQAVIRHGATSRSTAIRRRATTPASSLPHPELFGGARQGPAAADQRRQDPPAGDPRRRPTRSCARPKSAG